MRRLLGLLLILGVSTGAAFAHNGMLHIMGTVTSTTATEITVRAGDGKSQTVAVSSDTKYSRGSVAATLKDIAVGDAIVIHATKKGDQLTAAEVRVGVTRVGGPRAGVTTRTGTKTTPRK